MNRNLLLHRLPILVSAPVSSAASALIANELYRYINDISIISVIFISLFFLIVKLNESIINEAINNYIFLRKSILGSSFIEGWWAEEFTNIATISGDSLISNDCRSIMVINYRNGEYIIKGHLIDSSNNIRGSWVSTFSYYSDIQGQLEYFFRSPCYGGNQPPDTSQGYARLTFQHINDNTHPTLLEGEVIIMGKNSNHNHFVGRKIKRIGRELDNLNLKEFICSLLDQA